MHKPPARLRPADADRYSDDHRDLMVHVQALRRAADPAAGLVAYRRIRGILPGHLAEEEARDGLFAWVEALAPHRAADVEVLRQDHRQLEALLAELDAGALPSLSRLGELADRITDHERRENLLIHEVLAT